MSIAGHSSRIPLLTAALLALLWGIAAQSSLAAPLQGDAKTTSLMQQVEQARANNLGRLAELAAWCRERDALELAARTEAWAHRPHERLNYIFQPITEANSIEIVPGETADGDKSVADINQEWQERLDGLRIEQANALYQLAADAAAAGNANLALSLANEALRENPDHASARQLFGYVRHKGNWLTAYEIAKEKAGEVWHDEFGWIAAEDLPRYEAGERRNRSLWIPAERDAQIHQNIDNGWRIETEHFSITTNHSLEAGVALGARLEKLYDAWRIVFADYLYSDAQIRGAFTNGRLPDSRQRFRVMYFANEADFRSALARELPQNAKTTGVYLARRKTSYFYHADPEDHATQFHEVTHQLFQETPGRTQLDPATEADFWLIEAIACYMESLHEHPARQPDDVPYLTTGGVDATRVQDARFYLFRQDFHEPLADIAALGRAAFQQHPQIQKVYAQGGAIADMLMHADGGVYRQAVVRLLQALYQGRRTNLPQLTEKSYASLDELYIKWMGVTDADLLGCAAGDEMPYLALGGTDVTDAGLKQFATLRQVRWIDLAKTAVTDEGVLSLAKLPGLIELDLSATRITDAALEILANAPQLRKLTLSGTQVSDAAVQKLQTARPELEIVR